MLQGALIKIDKTVYLRKKNCYRNGLIMCVVVRKRVAKNKYGLLINDLLSFTHDSKS